jgi:hypothetical protein
MKRVTQNVLAQTEGQQRPWQTGTLQSEIFLAGPAGEPSLSPQLAASARTRPSAPLYKRWWLWATVGGAVSIAAVGLGLGLGLSQRLASLPPDQNTYMPSF